MEKCTHIVGFYKQIHLQAGIGWIQILKGDNEGDL
jgi:hypothetical protein